MINKRRKSFFIIIFTLLISFASCKGDKNTAHELILDSKYQQIKTIHSFANCIGPDGKKYTTEVKSELDGSCIFIQKYEENDALFSVKLTSDNKGFILNEQHVIVDTLGAEDVEIVRSHEFHKMHTNPSHFFDDIRFDKAVNKEFDLYIAKDKLNNPVNLWYHKKFELIHKIDLLNPRDTTEHIEIFNKEFVDYGYDYGKVVKNLEIVQGKKDTFYFNFKSIKINE